MRIGSVSIAALVWLLAAVLCASAQPSAPPPVSAPAPAAPPAAASCHGTAKRKDVAEFLFGRNIGDRVGVSEAAWTRFVAREMTPRFPEGLTITEAIGQWRDHNSGRIVREPSKQVEIVLPGNDDDEARIEAIVEAYKRAFHQQSVRVVVRSACIAN